MTCDVTVLTPTLNLTFNSAPRIIRTKWLLWGHRINRCLLYNDFQITMLVHVWHVFSQSHFYRLSSVLNLMMHLGIKLLRNVLKQTDFISEILNLHCWIQLTWTGSAMKIVVVCRIATLLCVVSTGSSTSLLVMQDAKPKQRVKEIKLWVDNLSKMQS